MEKTLFNDLSYDVRQKFWQEVYEHPNYFQEYFNLEQVEFDCKEYALAFRDATVRLLIEKGIIQEAVPLENLHQFLSAELLEYDVFSGVNQISAQMYETDQNFIELYYDFVKNFLAKKVFTFDFWFQAIPTIRIHCPGGKHLEQCFPRYHSDLFYHHPPEEFNIWLPLTEPHPAHGFRLAALQDSQRIFQEMNYNTEAFIDSAIHSPSFTERCDAVSPQVTTEFGRVLIFDPRCIHTTEPLHQHSRISVDVRINPVSSFAKSKYVFQGLGRRKVLFAPGNCYLEKTASQVSN